MVLYILKIQPIKYLKVSSKPRISFNKHGGGRQNHAMHRVKVQVN